MKPWWGTKAEISQCCRWRHNRARKVEGYAAIVTSSRVWNRWRLETGEVDIIEGVKPPKARRWRGRERGHMSSVYWLSAEIIVNCEWLYWPLDLVLRVISGTVSGCLDIINQLSNCPINRPLGIPQWTRWKHLLPESLVSLLDSQTFVFIFSCLGFKHSDLNPNNNLSSWKVHLGPVTCYCSNIDLSFFYCTLYKYAWHLEFCMTVTWTIQTYFVDFFHALF
jgi:hypothetical protein